ncbi:MAG: putative low temperature requirement protein [Marmoricola sp.]|nr:putative low temperature requirement protein [Marmoricola sp.]
MIDDEAQSEEVDRSTDTLELFFDLVFVFAMSQVTELVLGELSWTGFLRGVMALTAVWWAWVCFAWLTDTTADSGVRVRMLTLVAMSAMLVAAIALPRAIGQDALVFGCAYLCVRLVHLVLFLDETKQDPDRHTAAVRLVPTLLGGPGLVLASAFVDSPYRETGWFLAALIDLGGPMVVGVGGLRVLPAYFVDRHGSIIIIALGETITQVGLGASQHLSDPVVLTAVLCAVLISGQLWWSYFGLTDAAQARLVSTESRERTKLARDAYSYLHLLIVAGIVYFALGAHLAIAEAGDPLDPVPAVALTCGAALAYAGDVAYRWRDHHRLAHDRLAAAIASMLLVAPALTMPALATLTSLLGVGGVRIVWEAWRNPLAGVV